MKNELLNAQHLSLEQQVELLSDFVMSMDEIPKILNRIQQVPGAWLGAGIIFQNVWNVIHGFDLHRFIKDIDILYWDPTDLSWEQENRYIQMLSGALSDIQMPIDVKNIARVHLW